MAVLFPSNHIYVWGRVSIETWVCTGVMCHRTMCMYVCMYVHIAIYVCMAVKCRVNHITFSLFCVSLLRYSRATVMIPPSPHLGLQNGIIAYDKEPRQDMDDSVRFVATYDKLPGLANYCLACLHVCAHLCLTARFTSIVPLASCICSRHARPYDRSTCMYHVM